MAMWKKNEEKIVEVEGYVDNNGIEEVNVVVAKERPVRAFFKRVWDGGKYVILVAAGAALALATVAITAKFGEDSDSIQNDVADDIPYEEVEI